jgi:hypothetical protein
MLWSGLFFSLLAAGAATPPSKVPIVVKGHAWAPFISPMGEPFRARTIDDDTSPGGSRRPTATMTEH